MSDKKYRDRARELEINAAMQRAIAVYKRYDLVGDPYAMHKAVESIPPKILRSIANRCSIPLE